MGQGGQQPKDRDTRARASGWVGRSAWPCDAARKGEKASWAPAQAERRGEEGRRWNKAEWAAVEKIGVLGRVEAKERGAGPSGGRKAGRGKKWELGWVPREKERAHWAGSAHAGK